MPDRPLAVPLATAAAVVPARQRLSGATVRGSVLAAVGSSAGVRI